MEDHTDDPPARGAPPEIEGGAEPALEALSASARGWHRIQLAVLGFIGFCGILWEGDDTAGALVQYVGLALIVTAFVLAMGSILLVGRVAHPVGGPVARGADAGVLAGRTRNLRAGIWGTYVAVALLVLATLSSWLPPGVPGGEGPEDAVAGGDRRAVVVDVTARSWCGEPVHEDDEVVRLRTTEGELELPRDRIAALHPVGVC